jgi:hypothetical protein
MGKIFNVCCPKCGFTVRAKMTAGRKFRFLIFKCPSCNCNVVRYANKVDTLSDELVNTLCKKHGCRTCGNIINHLTENREAPITSDDLLNLKILLNTEQDSNRIIQKL